MRHHSRGEYLFMAAVFVWQFGMAAFMFVITIM
jgi:hypothetical protein